MSENDTEQLLQTAPPPSFGAGHVARLEASLAAHAPRRTVLRRPVPLWAALAASLLTGAVLFQIGRGGTTASAPATAPVTMTVSLPADLFGSKPSVQTDVSLWSMRPTQGDTQ